MSTKTRFFSFLLAVLMFASVAQVFPPVQAEAAEVPGFDFSLNEDGASYTLTFAREMSSDSIITIPAEYNGLPVTVIGDGRGSAIIQYAEGVVIPDSVTTINDRAISGCYIKSITISDSVTTIGNFAFYGCPYLTSINISKSVTSIGYGLVSDCESIQSVTVDIDNPVYYSVDNSIIHKETKTLVCGSYDGKIPADGAVEIIGEYAFFGYFACESCEKVTIPEGVTTIKYNAFGNNELLYAISIPSTLMTIEDYAFDSCYAIGVLHLEDTSIEKISANTLAGLPELYALGLPKTLTSIDINLIKSCSELELVYIDPENQYYKSVDTNILIHIESKTLIFGSKYTEEIPTDGSVTSIGDYAFQDRLPYSNLNIPDTVTSIGYQAFADNYSGEVTIPKSVKSIGAEAFKKCKQITINFQGTESEWDNISKGENWDKDSNIIINFTEDTECKHSIVFVGAKDYTCTTPGNIDHYQCTVCGCRWLDAELTQFTNSKKVVLEPAHRLVYVPVKAPTETTTGNFEYKYCSACDWLETVDGKETNMDLVTIPAIGTKPSEGLEFRANWDETYSVTGIGTCKDINIVIPSTYNGLPVTQIYGAAFMECRNIASVTIPDSITSIEDSAFYNCEKLINVDIGEGVRSIGEFAFYRCLSLTSIVIPDRVTIIDENAFYSCEKLTNVTIGNKVTSIGNGAFYNCLSLTSIIIPNSVTSIGKYAFYGCEKLTSIIIPDSVTSIGENAFYRCLNLTEVTLGNSVTSIGKYAFYSCEKLTSIIIPDSVTSIGEDAFDKCVNLTEVTLGNSVTSIGEYAFYGCEKLTSITIPDGVTSIGKYAFSGCKKLLSISIPDGVTSIEQSTFYNCSNLKEVFIPVSVKSIATRAFAWCDNITSFVYGGTEEQWNSVEKENDWTYDLNFTITFAGGHTHVWDAGVVTTQPTCFVEGIKTYTCSVCKATKTETIPTTGHSIQFVDAVAPTCETWGNVAYWFCKNCGYAWLDKELTQMTALKYVSLEPAHSLVHVDAKDFSCESEGNIEYWYCSACDWMQVEGGIATNRRAVILPAAHKLVRVEAKAATCFEKGNIEYWYCSACDWVEVAGGVASNRRAVVLPEIGSHTIVHVEAKAPTAYANGNIEYWYCAVCGYAWLDEKCTLNTNLLSVILPATGVSASEGLAYELNSDGTAYIVTGIGTCKDKELVIPSSYNGLPVTGIAENAFSDSSITSIYIPSTITSIGSQAFRNCKNLKATYIDDLVAWCNIDFDSNYATPVAYSGKLYIKGELLVDLVIPESVTVLQNYAFYGCTSIKTVVCHNNMTSLGLITFSGCVNLESIVLPANLKRLEKSMFANCRALKNITLPDTLQYIGMYAFNNSGIESITIPANVTSIGNGAFAETDNLKSIKVDAKNKYYMVVDNCLILIKSKMLIAVCGDYTIPADGSVTAIGPYAFYFSNMSEVALPDTIISIDTRAFNASNISSIVLPSGLVTINTYAFNSCSNLKVVYIPASVQTIKASAFANCRNITAFIYEGTEEQWNAIAKDAKWNSNTTFTVIFAGESVASEGLAMKLNENGTGYTVTGIGTCKDTDIVIPVVYNGLPVTSIGRDAFNNTAITGITIPGTIMSIEHNAFRTCDNLTKVNITSIAHWCQIQFMNIYSTPLYSGHNLYLNGELVTDLVIDDSIKSIANFAFFNCTSFKSISIGANVKTIGGWVFSGCSNVENATVSDSNKYYHDDGNCIILTSKNTLAVGFPVSVIPSDGSVTSVGDGSFRAITKLTSIVIPNTIKIIDWLAFADCTSLIDVTFTGTKAEWSAISLVDGWNDNCPFVVIHCIDGDVVVGEHPGVEALEFKLNEDGVSYSLVGIGMCQDKDIVIPAVYNGLPVTAIADYAFEGNKSITSITLPDGLVSIGYGAFYNCTALKKVVFSKSVSTFGNFILYGCTALTELVVEEGHKTLVSVNNCIIDYTTKTLIYGCAGSKIPGDGSVTSIGSYAFVNSGITSIVIPDAVTKIDSGAFENCKMLESIHIGSGTTSINSFAFQLANPYIKSFTIDESNPAYMAVNNCLINKKSKQLIVVFSGFVLPTDGSIKTIGQRAFADMSDITSIVIPEGVTSIGDSAFMRCTKLTSITFPSTLKTFTNSPLAYCDNLKTVTFHKDNETFTVINNCIVNKTTKTLVAVFGEFKIPSDGSVTVIGSYAFQYFKTLKSIELPVGITTINKYAFRTCSSLATITLPNTLTNINDYAFSNCKSLKTLIFNGTEEQWNSVVKSKYWNNGATFSVKIAGEPVHTHSFSAWIGYGEVHTRSCSCGAVETEEHSWGEGVITVYPTVTTVGCKTYECAVCRDVKIEDIPAYRVPDLDADGKIFYSDVQIVMQYITDSTVEIDVKAADINGDGEVNIRDAALFLQAMMYGILPN